MGNIFGLGFSSSFFPPSLPLRSIHSHVFRSSSACHSALYRYLHPLYSLNNGGRRRVCATRTRPTNEEKKSRATEKRSGNVEGNAKCVENHRQFYRKESSLYSHSARIFIFIFVLFVCQWNLCEAMKTYRHDVCVCVCVKFENVCSSVAIDTSSPPLRPSLYFPFA